MTTEKDQLADLLRAVREYDDEEINKPESSPTGTDYNNLYSLVMAYAKPEQAPLPISAPEQEAGTPTVYECEECDWTGTMDTINGIHHIHHIHERVQPGELVPAGCCPDCGAMIGVADRDVPHYTLYITGRIMRARGWSVAAPEGAPALPPAKPDVTRLLADAVRDTLGAYEKGYDMPWGTLRTAFAAYQTSKGA